MSPGFTPRVPPSKQAMQVRFFRSADIAELQRQLNAWLAEQPDREIVEVRQSAGAEILISVWYIG
jgi:hypothetical protein